MRKNHHLFFGSFFGKSKNKNKNKNKNEIGTANEKEPLLKNNTQPPNTQPPKEKSSFFGSFFGKSKNKNKNKNKNKKNLSRNRNIEMGNPGNPGNTGNPGNPGNTGNTGNTSKTNKNASETQPLLQNNIRPQPQEKSSFCSIL